MAADFNHAWLEREQSSKLFQESTYKLLSHDQGNTIALGLGGSELNLKLFLGQN